MPVKIYPEPHHEPVGFSQEEYAASSRWRTAAIANALILAAGIAAAILKA